MAKSPEPLEVNLENLLESFGLYNFPDLTTNMIKIQNIPKVKYIHDILC